MAVSVLAIVQARMSSTRLPGKVLKKLDREPLIKILFQRLSLSKMIDKIILGTSASEENDVLEDYVKSLGYEVYRGSEDDVMQRVIEAAESVNADVIVEITGDCPIIDPKIIEQTKVTGIEKHNQRVTAVLTDVGRVSCDVLVNCAGMWGNEVGQMCGVNIPLHAAEHFYIVTEPIPALPQKLPVVREPSACTYYKEDAGKLLVGIFESNAKPWGMDGIPEDFEFESLS